MFNAKYQDLDMQKEKRKKEMRKKRKKGKKKKEEKERKKKREKIKKRGKERKKSQIRYSFIPSFKCPLDSFIPNKEKQSFKTSSHHDSFPIHDDKLSNYIQNFSHDFFFRI